MRTGPALAALVVLACGGDDEAGAGRCSGCSISVTRATTFGALEGPASLLGDPAVREDSRGRFYVVGHATSGVLVFDSAGTYLRTIGQRGAGPGEFELISGISVDHHDTVYAFDRRHLRVTVISPDHAIVRTVRVPDAPYANQTTILPDGRLVIASVRANAGGALQPMHILDRDLGIEHSFGGGDPPLRANDQLGSTRMVASDDAGRIWSSRAVEYVLEHWSGDGNRILSIRHAAAWLPPRVRRVTWREGLPLPPPDPTVVAINVDADGYVWVLGSVVDANWKPPRVVRVKAGYKPIDEQRRDEAYDTMIEVFDGQSGEMVASMRHPMSFNQFARPRTLVHRDEGEDGRFLITTYSLHLVPGRQ